MFPVQRHQPPTPTPWKWEYTTHTFRTNKHLKCEAREVFFCTDQNHPHTTTTKSAALGKVVLID